MYTPSKERYETMVYNRCGGSGLKLPAVSLGLWHNFGDTACMDAVCMVELSLCVYRQKYR